MAHDDDVLHAQIQHGELESSRDAVEAAPGFIGRDQVGDVAHHEQFTGHGGKDRLRVAAAVAAGYDHHVGALPVRRQVLVTVAVGVEVAEAKAEIPVF